MRTLLASAVVTAALTKGVLIGIALGAAATICTRCALGGARRENREPETEERQGKAKGGDSA